jgi:hypothetical protein
MTKRQPLATDEPINLTRRLHTSIEWTQDKLRELSELARLQCTQQEAARVLGCAYRTMDNILKQDTLQRQIWEEGQAVGKKSLRRAQYEKAVKHANVIIQIWLGKQWLGQRDQVVQEIEVKGDSAKAELRALLDAMAKRAAEMDDHGKPTDDSPLTVAVTGKPN